METFFKRVFALALLVLLSAFDDVKLVKMQFEEGISMSIPANFTPMPDEMYLRRFATYRKPIAAFASPDGSATLSVNNVQNRSLLAVAQSDWNEKDMEMIKGMYKASIAAMHDEVEFLEEGITVINKRKFIIFEFIGEVKDKDREGRVKNEVGIRQYNYLLYTIEKGKMFVFSFSCPAKQKQKWQPIAKNIMQTIKIKK
ncbi:MAG: hypothetical protein NZ551_03695 [Microscillaceae bacterium]|nr:hypothetical protein [Microscillaceae bacterium]MDW8460292.1 hypothetical protein [Cytophagales bacterium]